MDEIEFRQTLANVFDVGSDPFGQLARESFCGWGFSEPNPPVSCLLLDPQKKIVARGYHARAGQAHAEIRALENFFGVEFSFQSGQWDFSRVDLSRLKNFEMITTLEPCSFVGRTPSCAQTLAQLPLRSVTSVFQDPHLAVSGRGFEILEKAGMIVDRGGHDARISEGVRAALGWSHEFFFHRQKTSRPFVTVKVATSLDGFLGLKNGQSQWLTSQKSREFARYLRGGHASVLVGAGTVLKDNPFLDRRETSFASEPGKVLFVFDPKNRITDDLDLKIFETYPDSEQVIVFQKQLQKSKKFQSVEILESRRSPAEIYEQLLEKAEEKKIPSIWIEGGTFAFGAALQSRKIDRLWMFQGPLLVGGQEGVSWAEKFSIENLNQGLRLNTVCRTGIGSDLVLTGQFSS